MSRHTLNEIAKRAGVSASTVSRVVNNIGLVKQETREKVLEAMSIYQYVPNQIARNLKLSRSNAVGIIVPDILEPYFANIIRRLEADLSERDYSMILCITNENADKERKYLHFMMSNMIDGAVVATVDSENDTHKRYIESGRALVFIDNLPEHLGPYGAILTDNKAASKLAVTHLWSLGHRNIAILAGRQEETTGAERLVGYLDAMRQRNQAVRDGWIRIGDFKSASGYTNMKRLLEENPEVTAVYANSSQMTYAACKAIEEAGLQLAEDFSVVGFDIHNTTGMPESNITSIVQQEDEMGRKACEFLVNAIEQKGPPPNGVLRLDPGIEVRCSTGPAKPC